MSEAKSARDSRLLVALNATPDVERPLLYRLAACDDWLARRGQGSPPLARPISPPALAQVRSSLRECERLAESEARRARDAGSSIVTRLDPSYPTALLDLPLPPPVLYVRGRLPPERAAVAIVGSRAARGYGLETARAFAHDLATRGIVVVSGLALGIDSAAHRGALEAPGGLTVAVLGCGIDIEYPRRSARLAERIAAAGAVIGELPMGTPPLPGHFPMRNRVIAALGVGTLVVRAAARSGSLITARLTLELGRDVYAVPGNIFDRRSVGPNSLIRDGALLVQHPREIVESWPSWLQDRLAPEERSASGEPGARQPALPEHLKTVLTLIAPGEAWSAEELAVEAGLEVAAVLAALLELELGGRVRRSPGPKFHRRE